MRYISLFSDIEAASYAWQFHGRTGHALDWTKDFAK